jgi:multicomponent Na+:H+ antiporter subunit E
MRAIVWWLLCAALWLVFTGGSTRDWGLGLAIITSAAALAVASTPPWPRRLSPWGLLLFVPSFLFLSIGGGLDVAHRAFRGRSALSPTLHRFLPRLEEGSPALLFFASTLNLIPGTLCVELEAKTLLIHVLDQRSDPTRTLRRLETRVAALFGMSLTRAASP